MPENPLSPYALSKLAGEKHCGIFHRIYGLSAVSLRYFGVFGPRQDSAHSTLLDSIPQQTPADLGRDVLPRLVGRMFA